MAGWVRCLPQGPSSQERFCNSSLGQKAADEIGLSLGLASMHIQSLKFQTNMLSWSTSFTALRG